MFKITFCVLSLLTFGLFGSKVQAQTQRFNSALFISQLEQAPVSDLVLGAEFILSTDFNESAIVYRKDSEQNTYEVKMIETQLNELSVLLNNEYDYRQGLPITISKPFLLEIINHSSPYPVNLEKIINDEVTVYAFKFPAYLNQNLYSIVLSTDLDCNHCEYGRQLLAKIIFNVEDNKIIDSLMVSYVIGNDIYRDYRFYYYNKGIFYIREFSEDELAIYINNDKKYTLSEQGRFIRYYEQNGEFKNEEEQGLVINHSRDGVWFEIKSNGYSGLIYLEAEYKAGLPVGEWRYYELEQDYDEVTGEPIISTRKKGRLLYTEIYENGKLISREFVE